MTERLLELIHIPSVTGYEGDAIERMERWLRAAGGDVDAWIAHMSELERDPDYPGREVEREAVPVVRATLEGKRPGPKIMLTGHVDVVPPSNRAAWTHGPFKAHRDGDRVTGCGAADMKSGLVGLLAVYEAFAADPDFAGELTLLAVPGEEDGGSGTLAAIRRGLAPDLVLIPEPTAGEDGVPRAVVAHAGALTYKMEVAGHPAHAAFRLEGESAFNAFVKLYHALEAAERALNEGERDELMRALGLPYATNVGLVRGGSWASTVMGALEADVRVGVALGESLQEADARIRATVDRAAAEGWLKDHPPKVTRYGGMYRAARTPSDHPLVTALQAASAEVFGQRAELAAMPYGCDMGQWRHHTGAAVVVYGPGRARVAHTVDEWVSVDAMLKTTEVLERTTRRMSSLR